MTEFITRSCKAENQYEIIIKTDSEEYYKATENFARKLIDHAKPLTNADRIRAMSDEELADIVVCPHTGNWDLCRDGCKKCRLEWLKQPAEENK